MNLMSDSDHALPRKVTAIGTMGEMGQLFTVYEANWNCKDCGQENYASRPRCFRCKKQKPVGEINYVQDPALEAARANKTIAWQEVIDPNSYQIYYHNKETGATQWERPTELGPAPLATGWFGRGAAGSNAAQKYKALNEAYLARPATKQKDFIDPKKYHVEGANEFNIWYGRFIGDMPERGAKQEAASDRCVLETDAGATKADSGGNKRKEHRHFCIHFAHGVCAKGSDCTFYHRIPTPEDDARCDELFDCFGRQRHSSHKDDMDGVGSFMKPCRTLFVGNLLKHKYPSPKAMEDALWRHFGEWGEVESLNVIHRLSIAFPRYRLRTSAEFAKEAMNGQSLDQAEILSIRWAYDDPNPVAQDSISRADKDALTALLAAKGVSTAAAPFEYPSDYQLPPEAKRLRLEGGGDLAQEHPELAYPNTDHQYVNSTAGEAGTAYTIGPVPEGYNMTQEQYERYCTDYYKNQAQDSNTAGPSTIESPVVNQTEAETKGKLSSYLSDLLKPATVETAANSAEANKIGSDTALASYSASGWGEFLDEDTGATYYYNAATGESSWEAPT